MAILTPDIGEPYIRFCNETDPAEGNTEIPNRCAWDFLSSRIPLLDCPDKEFMRTWYFRYWVLRKHIHSIPNGRVITEFLPPVGWAGKYNTIVMAAPHHLNEARWLNGENLAEEYLRFWYSGESLLQDYTTFLPHSALEVTKVTGDTSILHELYDAMGQDMETWDKGFTKDYGTWDPARYYGPFSIGKHDCGLYFTLDDLEGSEYSVGCWKGYRPFLNAAMYGSRKALAEIASLEGKEKDSALYTKQTEALREQINDKLWNKDLGFFTALYEDGHQDDTRDLYGYTPWLFEGLTEEKQNTAWEQLLSSDGFRAPEALPFLEQRHPEFALQYTGHPCKWNGPSWPLATGFMLKALALSLQTSEEHPVSKRDYLSILHQYAACQKLELPDGRIIPWIDENINPYTGEWISRTIRQEDNTGKDYNHSPFADLLITGLFGICPSLGNVLTIKPLLPQGAWKYFCLDRLPYHGHVLTLLYDETGEQYHQGQGLILQIDGETVGQNETIAPMSVVLR